MKIKEIIVVEGKSDTAVVKRALDVDTIETNGSAISQETLEMIRHAQAKRGTIILTDPDYPGQRIRQIIKENIPEAKHAFLPKSEATPKQKGKSVGIEHASIKAIQDAIRHVQSISQEVITSDVTKEDLLAYGLIAGRNTKEKREKVGDLLHIGYANGKQLLKRLQMFGVQKTTLEQALRQLKENDRCQKRIE